MIQDKNENSSVATALTALLAALCVFLSFGAKAQTWGGQFQLLSGTNVSPMLLHYLPQVCYSQQVIQPQTIVVTNINTNEAIYISANSAIQGMTSSNLYYGSGFWTNFPASAGWTNGATWSYTFPTIYYQVPTVPYGVLIISNGQFPSGSCTNGVGMQ